MNHTINTIRSYVVRAARMSDHQKDAYERLNPRYTITVPDSAPLEPLNWAVVFPHRRETESRSSRSSRSSRPVVVDIGFGMGDSLAQLAESRPDCDFLGIEVHKPGVGKLLGNIESRGLENVRIIQHDAIPVCATMIPHGTVHGIHLFFPDPWPKKRHHKRRLVRRGFPELIAPLLEPEGYLYMVTDWEDYALQMLSVLRETTLFCNRFDTFAPRQEWRPETAFERKGRRKGHAIYELLFRRT